MSDVSEETKTTRRRAVPVERAANSIVSLAPNEQKVNPPGGWSTYTSMYKQHPIVRAAIDKLAKSSVAAGYQFGARDSTQKVNEARAKVLYDAFARSQATGLLRQTYTDLLIYGDAYWFITKSRLKVPYRFLRQDPSTVTIVVDSELREITKYIVRDQKGNETQFDAVDFVHFKLFDPSNEVYGLSLLESLKSTVAQDLFAQTYNEAFFENSAQTGIVFNMRNASKEEVERNREFLKKEYVSAKNAHKPLLLEGDVSVSRSVASPAEMQFIEGRKQLLMEILAVFDIPYTKIGGTSESANRSQSSENDKSFRAESIVPLQSIVEEGINEQLIFTVFGFDDIIFAHKDVDQRDEAQKMSLFKTGLEAGVYTINEVRGWLGLSPIEGGDVPFVNSPLGLVPVSDISAVVQAQLEAKKSIPPATPAPGRPRVNENQP